MSTLDTIPVASRPLFKDIPVDQAVEVGQHLKARFDAWDQTPKGRNDPSLCRGLFRLPSGALFWQSKMAIDADGSPTKSVQSVQIGNYGSAVPGRMNLISVGHTKIDLVIQQ